MSTLFKRQMVKLGTAFCAAATLFSAQVATANVSTNVSTTAELPVEIEEAQSQSLSTGDSNFRELFASWKALDKNGPDAPVEPTVVSIPSIMPLRNSKLTSGYGMRNHPVLRKRRRHNGVDLAAPTGTPVYATADGMITRANWFSSYGLFIRIDHGADMETRFAHLSRIAVASGQRVRKGELIGFVGSTGRSTGPHLHYEVRVGGVAVNPIPYMKETQAQAAYANDSQLVGRGGQ